MFCKNCGRQLAQDGGVCPVCGTVNGRDISSSRSVEHGRDISSSRSVEHGRDISSSRSVEHGHDISSSRPVEHGYDVPPPRPVEHGYDVPPPRRVEHGYDVPPPRRVKYGYDVITDPNAEMKNEMANQALTWGVLSLVFAPWGGLLSFLGFIFSFIAKSKALAYERTFGVLEGKASVGRTLGKVGFGVGLGVTIYFTLLSLFFIIMGLGEFGAI